jgi:hypothetical protein
MTPKRMPPTADATNVTDPRMPAVGLVSPSCCIRSDSTSA